MITIQTECADRKEMVRKLSDFLSIPAVYMRTPTYAFQIGNITVNRDASITGPRTELAPFARFLMENGYINGWPADMFEEPAAVEPAEDLKADAADEDLKAPSPEPIDRVCVSIPLGNCTPQGLCNIIRMVYARQTHLRIEDDDEDMYLESLIAQAQAVAEDFCRTQFSESVPEPVRLAVLPPTPPSSREICTAPSSSARCGSVSPAGRPSPLACITRRLTRSMQILLSTATAALHLPPRTPSSVPPSIHGRMKPTASSGTACGMPLTSYDTITIIKEVIHHGRNPCCFSSDCFDHRSEKRGHRAADDRYRGGPLLR